MGRPAAWLRGGVALRQTHYRIQHARPFVNHVTRRDPPEQAPRNRSRIGADVPPW